MGLTPILPSKYASVRKLEKRPHLGCGDFSLSVRLRLEAQMQMQLNWLECHLAEVKVVGSSPIICSKIGMQLRWLERRPDKAEVAGSSPAMPTKCGSRLVGYGICLPNRNNVSSNLTYRTNFALVIELVYILDSKSKFFRFES